MKVKDYIARLSELDPEKSIYVFYDMYQVQEPTITPVSDSFEFVSIESGCLKPVSGDYLILAY